MADVAKGSVLLTPRFDNLEATISRQLEAAMGKFNGSSYGSKAGGSFSSGFAAKVGAIAGIVQSVASSAFSAVASSLDSAIARVDTLNNFPKVMANLGYSTEDAQASIDRLSAAIDGMPTSLDSIVSMTQQLAPMCGGLAEATDLSIALNNAFLAGGASTYDQARAMQQYTQMLAKGKPELEDWRTLQEVMPAQLDQIAQSLLGASAGSMDLYNALKSGEVTMDDFNGAIVALNEEGVNGFASFEEQAKASTQGIGTALQNVQNRISKAISTIIEAIGPENISGAINAFSESFAPIAETIARYIERAKSAISGFVSDNSAEFERLKTIVGDAIAFVKDNFGSIAGAVAGGAAAFGAFKGVTAIAGPVSRAMTALGGFEGIAHRLGGAFSSIGGIIPGIASKFSTFQSAVALSGGGLKGVLSVLGGFISPVGLVAAAVAALAAGFAYFYTTNEGFRNSINGIVTSLGASLAPILQTIMATLQQFAAAVIPPIMAAINAIAPVLMQIMTVLTQLAAIVVQFIAQVVATVLPIVTQIVALVIQVASAIITAVMPVIQQILAAIQTAMPVIQTVVTSVMGVIQSVVQTVWPVIQGVISTVLGAIQAIITAVMQIISGDWEGAWNTISSFLSGCWEGIKTTVSGAIDGVIQFFVDLPGNILSALGDLGGLLVDAGSSIIDGLVEGIEGAIGGAMDAVGGFVQGIRDLFPFSPAKVGPFSGHGYTTYSGRALVTDFAKSIERTGRLAESAMEGVMGDVYSAAAISAPVAAVAGAQPAYEAGGGRGGDVNLYIDGSALSVDGRIRDALEALVGAIARRYDMGAVTA